MNLAKLYTLHFQNVDKFYDTCVDKKEELASRIPGCATVSNRTLLNIIWWVMVVVEPFMSISLVLLLFPKYLLRVLFREKMYETFVAKNIALCYAGLACQRITAVREVYDKVDYYLYPIAKPESWIVEGKEQHTVLEQITATEVIKAFLWSLLAIVVATCKTHGKYLYRNYLCFEYFLTYYYLEKLSLDSTLYFVNHLDRWAVLFNQAPQIDKVLLQHGIEDPTADWPVKLTNVNKAYVFSESQKERLVKAVLGHIPKFEIMPPTITLSEMPDAKEKNIVIVACQNYMFYDKDEYVIKNLVHDNLRVYVKIHPGKNDYQKYEKLQKSANPNVGIISTQTFPDVDAVVSYYSTLGIEYEAHNKPVLYYEEMSLDTIIQQIKTLLHL